MLLRHSVLFLLVVIGLKSCSSSNIICNSCTCTVSVIDCRSKNLELMFEYNDWPNVTLGEMNVTEAYLGNNNLVHIKKIPSLPSLVKLSFSHNRVQRIELSAFQYLQNLVELDLSHNELTSPLFKSDIFKGLFHAGEYMPLESLRILRLGSNSLHTFRSDIFEHVERLEVLTLDFNPLRVIDTGTESAITSLTYLKVLDLSYTDLKTLPQYLLHAPKSLQELNLTGNVFTRVPAELMHSHNLTKLVLSANPIAVLSEENGFPDQLRSLKVLEMNWMPNLTSIEEHAMSNLQSLEEFHCSHNKKLVSIDANAFHQPSSEADSKGSWPPLRKLLLKSNKLENLDEGLLARWDLLREVDIEDNEWVCDCDNQWMVTVLEPIINYTRSELLTNIYCEHPDPMKGQNMFDLQKRHYHMRCLDADGNHPERDAKLLIGVLVGVLVAIPATLAGVLFWRRGLPWFSTSPAAYSRTFYKRAEPGEDF